MLFLTEYLDTGWYIVANRFTEWFYSPRFVGGILKYSICILTGIVLAYFICTKEGERMGIKKEEILTCCTFVVPLSILGARIWYLLGDGDPLFQNLLNDAIANLENINFFTKIGAFFKAVFYTLGYMIGFTGLPYDRSYYGISGLAIHGGIFVAFLMTVICCKWKKWKVSIISDMVAPGLLIGQICGRWGNFFNQEAHGMPIGGMKLNASGSAYIANLDPETQFNLMTKKYLIPKFIARFMYMEGEWNDVGTASGMMESIPIRSASETIAGNFYHPTFLYESLLNLLGLILYFILRRRKFTRSGYFAGFYLIWYGVVRFFIEIARMDSLYLKGTNIKMAQLTSAIMVVLGIFIVIYCRFIKKTDRYVDIIEKEKNKNDTDDSNQNEEVSVVNIK